MKHTTREHTIGMIYVLAAITAWGTYFPFAKLILLKLSPIVFLVFRLGIGAMVLLAMCLFLRKSLTTRRSDLVIILIAGGIGIVLHQLVQVTGLKHTTATNTGWILTLIPPVTGLLGWMVLKERVALKQIAGLFVAMIGVVFFVSNGKPTTLSLVQNIGDVLALTSVVTWSTYTVITKSRLSTYDPMPVSATQMVLGFVVFLLIGSTEIPQEIPVLSRQDWLIVILIGIVPSGLAYYWWNAGLKRLSAVNTSTFLFIEAIVASIVGFVLLGEQFTLPMIIAAVIIIIGVWITQVRRA